MSKFKVGDRVRVIADCKYRGEVTTVEAVEIVYDCSDSTNYQRGSTCYALDFPAPSGQHYIALEHHIAPAYDGHEKTSWSECAWKPSKVSA